MSVKAPDRVLVIGGCGFLGHHIVQQLLDSGCKNVSVLDLRTDRNKKAGVSYHSGDITSESDVQAVLQAEKPVGVIHTASPLASEYVPDSVFDKVNVRGTANLLQMAGKSGCVQAFVYTSSASVVHDYQSDLRFADETWPVLQKPATPDHYAHTKGLADDLVTSSNRKYGDMLTAAIRPAGIFGEGDVQMIPGMVSAYTSGKTGVQIGDNSNLWDHTYVGNVAHAHLLALQALVVTHERKGEVLDHERVDGEAFFITNDSPVPFWDFMRKIWAEAGWTGGDRKPWVIPAPLGHFIASAIVWVFWIFTLGFVPAPVSLVKVMNFSTQTRTYNIEKAKKRLGYLPIVGLEDGIRRGVRWHLQNEKEKAK